MPRSKLTASRVLTLAALTAALCLLIQLGGGCAGGASRESAMDSYVQGVLAYQKGDTTKAMTDFKEAVNKNGDLVMARSMLGDLYRAKSEYEAAREQYEVLTRMDPYYYFNHFRLGLSYQLLERYRDAARSYLKSLDLKPDDAGSNMYLGTVYLELGDKEQAVKYAQRAADLDPNSAAAFANLGVTYDDLGEHAKSESAYRKSLDLDSTQTPVRLFLAKSLMNQKKFGEARSVLAELVKIEDTALHRTRLGDALLGEKKFAEAIAQYQTALKLDSEYFQALNGVGMAQIGDYEKGLTLDDTKRKAALDAWQQSLSLKGNQPRITALIQKYSKAAMFQP